MLNSQKNGLQIFDNFQQDWSLPKFKREPKTPSNNLTGADSDVAQKETLSDSNVEAQKQSDEDFAQLQTDMMNMPSSDLNWSEVEGDFSDEDVLAPRFSMGGGVLNPSGGIDMDNLGGIAIGSSSAGLSIWDKFVNKFKPKAKDKKKEEELPKINVFEFFAAIKTELKDIPKFESKVNDYINMAKYAKRLGQTALYEDIRKDLHVVKSEAILLSDGKFKTIVTEEQVVKFYKECEKGLELTWMQNFTRIIPSIVSDLKLDADKLKVFDNYVILHYDLEKKSFKMTQAEIEAEANKKKDPILFGVIQGIRKLYYIADWEDEFCNLTLKDFIDKFGEEAITKNNVSVKYRVKE